MIQIIGMPQRGIISAGQANGIWPGERNLSTGMKEARVVAEMPRWRCIIVLFSREPAAVPPTAEQQRVHANDVGAFRKAGERPRAGVCLTLGRHANGFNEQGKWPQGRLTS